MLVFKHEFREAICCIYIQNNDATLFSQLAQDIQKDQQQHQLISQAELIQK